VERSMTLQRALWATVFFLVFSPDAMSQIRPPNYDESLVPKFDLPHVLDGPDGKRIASTEAWPGQREYLVTILATQ